MSRAAPLRGFFNVGHAMSNGASSPDLLLQFAAAALQHDAAAAERSCREALVLAPNRIDALELLGAAINAQARAADAARIFAELTRREPQRSTHWMNLGTVLRACDRRDEALAAYARAAALGQASADFFYNVGLLHTDRGDPESARAVLDKARRLAPSDAEIGFQYAQSCQDCLRNADALAALEHWQSWHGLTTDLLAKIGFLLLALGDSESAATAIGRAEADPQPSVFTRLKLAQLYERTNRLAAAGEQLAKLKADARAGTLGEELIATEAQFAEREGRHDAACRMYADVLRGCTEFRLRHVHLFPYAKCLDALGRYDAAFDALTEAHRSQIEHLGASAPEALTRRAPTLSITRYGCDPADFAEWRDADGPSLQHSPIFIVAFPRSGTTLLEQCLDAHPLLRSMDEQPFLQNAIDLIMDRKIAYPEALGRMTPEQLDAVRQAYWRLTEQKVRLGAGQRLIDKNPLNLLRLPAIRRLFPNARVLLAVRHPCDVVLSCFMQHFTAPEFALLCRDLPTLAQGFRQAFDFWYREAALLEPKVREIRYETFVADFDNQVRELSGFLELPFDAAMLAPAAHARRKGFIATPSYSQVVQPVHRGSIDRWRRYAAHLAPALPMLQPYLQRWSYGDAG